MDTLDICTFSSIAKLVNEYEMQINKIKDNEIKLREVSTQLMNKTKQSLLIEGEMKALDEERDHLKSDKEGLKLDLDAIKWSIEEAKKDFSEMESAIINKEIELQNLDNIQ